MRMDNGTSLFAFILLSFRFSIRAFSECSLKSCFFFIVNASKLTKQQNSLSTKTKLFSDCFVFFDEKRKEKFDFAMGKVKVSKKLSLDIAMEMPVMEQGQNCWAIARAWSKYLTVQNRTFPSAVCCFLSWTMSEQTTNSWPILTQKD